MLFTQSCLEDLPDLCLVYLIPLSFECGYNFVNVYNPRSAAQDISDKCPFECFLLENSYIFSKCLFPISKLIKLLSWAYEQPEMNSLTFLFVVCNVVLASGIIVPSLMLMRIFALSFFCGDHSYESLKCPALRREIRFRVGTGSILAKVF